MITYHKGDLLKSGCDIIAHQVNLQGILGGGLALQIAKKYSQSQIDLLEFVEYNNNHNLDLLGDVASIYEYKDCSIAHCFSQNKDFNTVYWAVEKCFKHLVTVCKSCECKTIGVPQNYGCGIAHGDWNIVERIFKDIFGNEPTVELQIWEL